MPQLSGVFFHFVVPNYNFDPKSAKLLSFENSNIANRSKIVETFYVEICKPQWQQYCNVAHSMLKSQIVLMK